MLRYYHISYVLEKALVLFIIWSKCKNEDEKLFKEGESIGTLKILGLIEKYNYFKNMGQENISQKFNLQNIGEIRNYLIEEINGNELIGKKHRKVCTTLNYIYVLQLLDVFQFFLLLL